VLTFLKCKLTFPYDIDLNILKTIRIELPNDRSETFIRAIENKAHPEIDLVCCILTNNRKDRYDAIKKVLCVDCPIPSQVLLFRYKEKNNNFTFFSRCFYRKHYKNKVN
jgi:hypothetical protein